MIGAVCVRQGSSLLDAPFHHYLTTYVAFTELFHTPPCINFYLSFSTQVLFAYLVGVLHDEVLALLELHADVHHTAQDAPGILHVQVDLVCKLSRLKLLRPQDHVLR